MKALNMNSDAFLKFRLKAELVSAKTRMAKANEELATACEELSTEIKNVLTKLESVDKLEVKKVTA